MASAVVDLLCDMVAIGRRLGFKKRWGRDEGWVVYGFEGGLAFSFSVFLVCGSELCGLDWEILGIGLRNELCGSDWEMEKGNSPCVERIGCVRERILSIWREEDGGARCVDRSLESTCCFECVWESSDGNCLKWKWERKWFYALGPLFYGQHWKYFQFDPIFQTNQIAHFMEKHFWN